jgi:pimeloyl-ACP methyl ester carboxylesterase
MQVGYTEKSLNALPPGSRSQVIAGAGHFLQADQPQAVGAAIMDYLGL